jgi:hypothetical protein
VNLDAAAPAVKKLVSTLPMDPEGVELALADRVVCKVVPPRQLAEADKAALLAEGKELLRRARARNKGVPARVLDREITEAVRSVRKARR